MARHPRAKAPGKDLLKDLLKVAFKQRRLRTAATSRQRGFQRGCAERRTTRADRSDDPDHAGQILPP